MAVTRAAGEQKPENPPALTDALNRRANIIAGLHEGEIPIPRGVLAASPQLYAAIEKAFQNYSKITGEPVDWMDYIARKDKPARRVFDIGDGFDGGDYEGGGYSGFGGFDDGADVTGGPSDQTGHSSGDVTTSGQYDAMGTVGGYSGVSPSGQQYGVDYDTFDVVDQWGARNIPGWEAGSLNTTPGAINTAARFGASLLAPTGLFAPLSIAAMFTEPGTQQDFEGMTGYGLEGSMTGGEGDIWDRILPSQYAASPTATSWARPDPADLGRFGDIFGGMDDRQIRASIASRALYDDRNRGLYTENPTIQDIYGTRLAGGLINPQGGLNTLDAVMPVEQQYLTQARGLTYNDVPSLLRAIGYG